MKKYLLCAFLLSPMAAWAVLPFTATPAEQAMCQARVNSRLDRSDPDSGHMHHYCDGLRFIDRAYAAMGNKRDMQHYLKESIDGFDYVLRSVKDSYVMRGEVHYGKARALMLMGKKAESVGELHKALSHGFDAPRVYQALADYYREAGNNQKAMEMVTEGLGRNPDSKGLKRRYTEFGGKLPYPKAVDKAIVDAEKEAEIDPQAKIEAVPLQKNLTSQASDPTNPTVPNEPTPLIEPPEIGSKKNPYCRFCPD